MTIAIYIVISIISFCLGYYFCKKRYNVKGLIRLADCQADFIAGDITRERALEIINEIEK